MSIDNPYELRDAMARINAYKAPSVNKIFDEIFGSPRRMAAKAVKELQAEELDASLTRCEIDQKNRNLMAQIEAHRLGGSE